MTTATFRQIVARKLEAAYAGTASASHYREMAEMIRAGAADAQLGEINAQLNAER
jgi:hypothetical protein